MALTQAQKSMIEKARAGGGSEQGITLDDASCAYLVAVAANDLGISNHFPELPRTLPAFYEAAEISTLAVAGVEFQPLIDRLVSLNNDALLGKVRPNTYPGDIDRVVSGAARFHRPHRRWKDNPLRRW